MKRRALVIGLMLLALASSAVPGQAQVHVSIGINLPAPPSLVIIPSTPVAYAPAVPANVFFYGGQYWIFANDAWHVGPTYGGPWVFVEPPYIPLPLLTVPVRYFRAPPPAWRQWRRDVPPRWEPGWGHEWHQAHADYVQPQWEKAGKGQKQSSKGQDKHAKEMEKGGKGHSK